MPIVATPDGKKVNFPDGTPVETIERVMREQFGGGGQEGGAGQTLLNQAISFFGGANETIAALLGAPVDVVKGALDSITTAAGFPPPEGLRQMPSMGQNISGAMQSVGVSVGPRTGTQGERLAGAAGRGAGGAALFGPGAIIPGIIGGLAAGVTEEAGGGPAAQVAASLAGGIAGAGAQNLTVKTARSIAGAPGTPQLQALRAEGVSPRMVGDVAESRTARGLTAGLQNAPITGSIIQRAAQQTTDDIAAAVERRASSFGTARTPAEAGQAIETGVQTYADRVGAVADKMYTRLRTYIPGVTPVAPSATQQVIGELTQKMPGLPKTSAALTPSMFKNLADDLTGNATPSFETLSAMRTEVGKKLTDPWLIDDIGRGETKRLYAALTADLRTAAQNISPQALKQFDKTNAFYSERMEQGECRLRFYFSGLLLRENQGQHG
jgi:hypothetical protein